MLNNAFQNVCRFRDIRGQRFAVLAPKIPYYVTYDLNFDIEIVKIKSSASCTNNKLLTGKICLKDFWPFLTPNYKGASPFCLVTQERSCHFKHFLFYKKKKPKNNNNCRATSRSSGQLAPKIPNYVIHDLNSDIRSQSSRRIILLL